MKRVFSVCSLLTLLLLAATSGVSAQGVTTGGLSGTVTSSGAPVEGVNVVAVHLPSGTRYGTQSREGGRFSIPGMRVGGPYTVTVTRIGLERQARENVIIDLGEVADLDFDMRPVAVEVEGVTVTSERDAIMSSDRTGAQTSIRREALQTLPTISGRLESVARLTPQSSGGMSFAGQDNRMNNITIDGSYFNNSFGLAGTPGERTGVAPISLAAVEQVAINIAPFDVRQGTFIGAGINTVTRSGTNDFRGSIGYSFRNENMVGTEAGSEEFDPGTFDWKNFGGWVSGPIVPNRMFFFVNYEKESLTEPGTTFLANTGNQPAGGSITRVKASDLDALSAFLSERFSYTTGPYQGYIHEIPATRFLAKVDINVSERNKASFRYNLLNSSSDNPVSNSSSLGFGSRRSNTTGLNFQGSNYTILENIRSFVGELNSLFGSNMANNLIVGYTTNDESRGEVGTLFPFVDILEQGTVYTSFGSEPFTPNNELRYNTFQFQNNFTRYGARHDLTLGFSAERFESENIFFPGKQSAYVYNSLADFYTDVNDYFANPNRTTSPVTLRRFQVRWSNVPGMEKPVQPLEVLFAGVYAQDQFRLNDRVKLTLGLRMDVPSFGETGFINPQVDSLTFRDENGQAVRFSTSKLPNSNALWSPRLGFNWDLRGDRSTQLRGGTGVFTGRPAFVWISNQIGENGILTGFQQLDNTRNRPFHPDPDHYKPPASAITGAPAASYGLAFTNPDFRFPQVWRNNLGIDQRLPFGFIGTLEFLLDRDVNGIYYINANLREPNGKFAGADQRPRWVGGSSATRINPNITSAIVMKNENVGRSWNTAVSLERPFAGGSFLKAAYAYGEAKNTVDPGSIAFGTWNNNPHAGDPNNPGLGFSVNSPGHRFFAAGSWRAEYFSFGATTLGIFFERRASGNTSYTYSGDLNGDGGFSNDLIYIPRDISEMNFQTFCRGRIGSVTDPGGPCPAGSSGTTVTSAEQAAAWEAYIQQDEYLRDNRGRYAERGAVFLPAVTRADLSFQQELFTNVGGRRNSLGIRADILNVGNLLNSDWGIGQRFIHVQPLIVPSSTQGGAADAQGRAQYRMRAVDNQLMTTSLEKTAFLGDVYRFQIGLRYTFN